jgi:hypothetical protein
MDFDAEAFPHRDFWLHTLPELLQEGFAFSGELVEKAREKWRGGDKYENFEESEGVP